jgi:hypothetical protein
MLNQYLRLEYSGILLLGINFMINYQFLLTGIIVPIVGSWFGFWFWIRVRGWLVVITGTSGESGSSVSM